MILSKSQFLKSKSPCNSASVSQKNISVGIGLILFYYMIPHGLILLHDT